MIGRRRFLDLDVQASDGSWTLRRIYVRAQPSRELFRSDLPFVREREYYKTSSKIGAGPVLRANKLDLTPLSPNCNENVNQGFRSPSPILLKGERGRAARLPVLIAPRASMSAAKLIVIRGITFWRCYKVWKPRLRSQACLEGCEISGDWSDVMRDLAALVKWFFDVLASRVRRGAWGSLTSQKKGAAVSAVSLVEFLRPEPWPPPSRTAAVASLGKPGRSSSWSQV